MVITPVKILNLCLSSIQCRLPGWQQVLIKVLVQEVLLQVQILLLVQILVLLQKQALDQILLILQIQQEKYRTCVVQLTFPKSKFSQHYSLVEFSWYVEFKGKMELE